MGLEVKWRVRFVPQGSHAETTPGAVYIDVGGRAAPGIIDHHEGDGDRCASAVALHRRELAYNHLLGPWLARVEEGRVQPGTLWTPTIITHRDPDWDSLVAIFLVQRLVEDGDLPAFAGALVSYASDVDQGRYALVPDDLEACLAPHLGYLAIQHSTDAKGNHISSDAQLARGLRLLQTVVEDVAPVGRAEPSDFLPANEAARRWSVRAEFEDIRRLLADERGRFERDRQCCRTLDDVLLPAADGGPPIKVRTLVLDRPSESALNKYWVRAAGFPYFICPYATTIKEDLGRVPFPRAVLSLDPSWNDNGRRPNLRGLGFALERAESLARRGARGGVDDRGGAPRFPDGYCDNADPWYDGRAHDWTIVDSPAAGTELTYHEVIGLATGGSFWQVPLRSATVTLALLDREPQSDANGPPFAPVPFADASVTLSPFFADTRESARPADAVHSKSAEPFAVRFHQRHFPEDTAPGFRLVTIVAGGGATLEALVDLQRELGGGTEPVLTFARITLGYHFASPQLVDRLLEAMAGGGLDPVESERTSTRTFCSSHSLVRIEPEEDARYENAADPLREIALYVAFLREALSDYSRRIAEAVPPAGRPIDEVKTEALRRSFLRLQARYYTIEVSRGPELQTIFNRLAETTSLREQYDEVQQELEQLGRLEQHVHERRKSRADRVIQAALYFLAVAGLARVVMDVQTWQGSARSLWLSLTPVLVVGILIYVVFFTMSRRR